MCVLVMFDIMGVFIVTYSKYIYHKKKRKNKGTYLRSNTEILYVEYIMFMGEV